jgi:hypothetical protein
LMCGLWLLSETRRTTPIFVAKFGMVGNQRLSVTSEKTARH